MHFNTALLTLSIAFASSISAYPLGTSTGEKGSAQLKFARCVYKGRPDHKQPDFVEWHRHERVHRSAQVVAQYKDLESDLPGLTVSSHRHQKDDLAYSGLIYRKHTHHEGHEKFSVQFLDTGAAILEYQRKGAKDFRIQTSQNDEAAMRSPLLEELCRVGLKQRNYSDQEIEDLVARLDTGRSVIYMFNELPSLFNH